MDLENWIEFRLTRNRSNKWNTKIRPVNFSTEHRNMLSNLHAIISKGYLAINEKHDKLITSLRTVYAEELNLKKDQTSYSDLLDALRLALKGYEVV